MENPPQTTPEGGDTLEAKGTPYTLFYAAEGTPYPPRLYRGHLTTAKEKPGGGSATVPWSHFSCARPESVPRIVCTCPETMAGTVTR